MAAKTKTTAAAEEQDPNGLIYMHHPETGGIKAIRRRSLGVWGKKGWKEGSGPKAPEGLPETPAIPAPVVVNEDSGEIESPSGASIATGVGGTETPKTS